MTESPHYFLKAAAEAHAGGRREEIRINCRRAGVLAPNLPAPYVNLASLLAKGDEDTTGSDWVERAAGTLSTGDPAASRNMAVITQLNGYPTTGLRWLRRSLLLAPGDSKTLYAYAKQAAAAEDVTGIWPFRAVVVNPGHNDPWILLITRLVRCADLDGVIRKAAEISLQPCERESELLRLLVHCYTRSKTYPLAMENLEVLIQRDPEEIQYRYSMTGLLSRLGDHAKAKSMGRSAVLQDPGSFDALAAYSAALTRSDSIDGALDGFRRALILDPQRRVELLEQYGAGLVKVEYGPGAARVLQESIVWDPGNAGSYLNLGTNEFFQLNLNEAERHICRSLLIDADLADGLYNLGLFRRFQGRVDEARTLIKRARTLKDDPTFSFTLALIDLGDGDPAVGLKSYESRWRVPKFAAYRKLQPVPTIDLPVWKGEPLAGRRLAVWGEQGVGDELWFASYLSEVAALADHVIVEVATNLVELFKRSFPTMEILPRGEPRTEAKLRSADYQVPMGGLMIPLNADKRPVTTGYLKADPERIAEIRARHSSNSKPLIGISWRSRKHASKRSFEAALSNWEPIFRHKDWQFVSLQYGPVDDDVRMVRDRFDVDLRTDPDIDPLIDMDSFGAQVAAMDAIVSIANSSVAAAHGMRVPCYVALRPIQDDWRYPRLSSISRWLPMVCSAWQPDLDDWKTPLGILSEALQRDLDNKARRGGPEAVRSSRF